jgi:hypothetical protein
MLKVKGLSDERPFHAITTPESAIIFSSSTPTRLLSKAPKRRRNVQHPKRKKSSPNKAKTKKYHRRQAQETYTIRIDSSSHGCRSTKPPIHIVLEGHLSIYLYLLVEELIAPGSFHCPGVDTNGSEALPDATTD